MRHEQRVLARAAAGMKGQRQGGFLLAKIHQLGGRVFARLLRERGVRQLNPAQGRIMFVLWREDGIPIKELARRTQLDKSTLTSMLNRLEQAGLVRREPSRDDRRQILLWRTQKDQKLEALYAQVSREMTGIFYRDFAAREIAALEAGLERVLHNLESVEAATSNPAKPCGARERIFIN